MEITWLGHSCFKLKSKSGTLIADPFGEGYGYQLGRIEANIVTISHDHPGHNNSDSIKGDFKLIAGPGEFEIAGIFVYGVRTFHDDKKGEERGKNTSFLIEMDGIKVCHLGDLGHIPTATQLDDINDADVLLVPVGGKSTIETAQVIEVVNLISPSYVIPMHYKTQASTRDLETAEAFLKEIGIKEYEPVPKLSVTKSTLPLDMQTIVMDYKQ
jgi:L-ascorbate metabolism protein UlaG (beta-lactamase superfamily)